MFDRTPFSFLAVEGELAHFGEPSFLVANGIGTERAQIFVAPLNVDFRPSCSLGERRERFENASALVVDDASPTVSAPTLTRTTDPLGRTEEDPLVPLPSACPL